MMNTERAARGQSDLVRHGYRLVGGTGGLEWLAVERLAGCVDVAVIRAAAPGSRRGFCCDAFSTRSFGDTLWKENARPHFASVFRWERALVEALQVDCTEPSRRNRISGRAGRNRIH